MVQVPAIVPVTVATETLQMVGVALLLYAMARPDVALALAVVVPPTARVLGVKLMAPMVWATLTVMLCVTCVAAL
jgi:hypothetical protein